MMLMKGAFLPLEWLSIVIVLGAISAVLVTLYAIMRKQRGGEKKLELEVSPPIAEKGWPTPRVERSVTLTEVKKAQDELRILELEREILSFAIRRLYEAQAEGKITEEERERLAQLYKSRMMEIKEAITRSESVVALHELESMREDLIKLFSDRFEEINRKIEEIRARIEIKPEVKVPAPAPPKPTPEKVKKKRVRKPPTPKKTEAERRIEQIRAEVEKVLARLEQIEVEA